MLSKHCQCHKKIRLDIFTIDDAVHLENTKISTLNFVSFVRYIWMMMANIDADQSNEKAANDYHQEPTLQNEIKIVQSEDIHGDRK